MDHADDDLTIHAECDGNAEMGDAIEEIHRAIDGIDDPLSGGILVSGDSFLAIESVSGTSGEEDIGDEILGFFVERELDVVMQRLIHHQ